MSGGSMRCSAWGFLKARADHRITEGDWQLRPSHFENPNWHGLSGSDRDRGRMQQEHRPATSAGVPWGGTEVSPPRRTLVIGMLTGAAGPPGGDPAFPVVVQEKRRNRPSHACRPFRGQCPGRPASSTYRRGFCFGQCGAGRPREFGPALSPPRSSLERGGLKYAFGTDRIPSRAGSTTKKPGRPPAHLHRTGVRARRRAGAGRGRE